MQGRKCNGVDDDARDIHDDGESSRAHHRKTHEGAYHLRRRR